MPFITFLRITILPIIYHSFASIHSLNSAAYFDPLLLSNLTLASFLLGNIKNVQGNTLVRSSPQQDSHPLPALRQESLPRPEEDLRFLRFPVQKDEKMYPFLSSTLLGLTEDAHRISALQTTGAPRLSAAAPLAPVVADTSRKSRLASKTTSEREAAPPARTPRCPRRLRTKWAL